MEIQKQKIIAGVDEVGRGSWFGPVFAGAVVLSNTSTTKLIAEGLADSKTLTPRKRAHLVPIIKSQASSWGLGQASSKEIDELGIRRATETAMLRALQKLSHKPDLVLVDGSLPLRLWLGPQENIIKGDSKYAEISAASVIAKEARDELIKRLAKIFPEFGLEQHVGYGTKKHKGAILKQGPSRLHRISFLKKVLTKNNS